MIGTYMARPLGPVFLANIPHSYKLNANQTIRTAFKPVHKLNVMDDEVLWA